VWYFLFFKNLLGVAMVGMVAMASLAGTKALSNAQASAAAADPRDGSGTRARASLEACGVRPRHLHGRRAQPLRALALCYKVSMFLVNVRRVTHSDS